MDRELAIERFNKMRRVCDMEECNINCELCEEALDLAIEALQESTDKYTNATTNLYDSRLAKDLLGISEEAKKLQLFGETSTKVTHDKHTETHGVCLDCISRADTIKAMCSKCVINRECIGECSDVVAIKNMPSVWSERPKGRWVFDTELPAGGGRESAGYFCSICGADFFKTDSMNFCPNCGADMRGEKE